MENEIIIKGVKFKPLLTPSEIQIIVSEIAQKIKEVPDWNTYELLCVLKGSFVFVADLSRMLSPLTKINFIKASSYHSGMISSGIVELEGNINDLKGKKIILCEDIIETGNTIDKIYTNLINSSVTDIKIVTLFFKPGKWNGKFGPDITGKILSDEFIIGYGLDLDGYGRGIPGIWIKEK